MDKKFKKAALATTMIALSALPAQHVLAVDAVLNVEANIAPAGNAITAPDELNFGTFMVNGAGSIIVNPVGAPAYNQATSVGSPSAGNIRVYAYAGPYTVDLSLASTSVILSNGSDTMTVDNFNFNTDAGGTTHSVAIGGGSPSTALIPIGGTLNFGAAQPSGTYSGAITVNAAFN